jgi:small subunit ribosomal protein S17
MFSSLTNLEDEYQAEIADVRAQYEERQKRKQSLVGKVVSTKAAKSVTIAVQRRKYVSKYNAYKRITKKVMVHDEDSICNMGDIIRVIPCRPKSKMKRHIICDILFKEPQIDLSTLAKAANPEEAQSS